ncbi:MAG: CHAT domain-containing protein [Planctomycetota bacterium]
MLALVLALSQQTFEPFPPTPFDRVIPITIDEQDSELAGHGRGERATYKAEFEGTLHLWTKSEGELDPFLRIETPDGELVAEDGDSGGGKTPYLKLEVEPGRELMVIVAVAQGEVLGRFDLCAIAAPETGETRAVAEEAGLAIAEVIRLRDAGDLEAGRERAQRALDLLLAVPGGSSSELLASSTWELGYETYGLSILRPAQSAWRHVLQHRLRTLPEEHENLQRARGNMAVTIAALGDLQGARALEERVLEVRTKALPEEHPDLQKARLNLAATIEELGDLQGARALLDRVVEVRTKTLPEEHPDLQAARMNLAGTIAALGDLQGARALEERVLEVFLKTLPEEHPNLQAARLNLAGTIKALGDLQGARALEERALEVRTKTLPEEHPDLQRARLSLAGTIRGLGDLQGARALEERVLEVRTKTLPEDHPHLQAARLNLAVTIQALGNLQGARALLDRVLEVRTRTLPEEHPDLQLVRLNLAVTALRQASGSTTEPGGQGKRTGERERWREKGASLLRECIEARARSARELRLNTPGREAEERCASLTENLGFTLSVALGYGGLDACLALQPAAFLYSESTRNAGVSSSSLGRRAARLEGYAEARAQLRSATVELARLVQGGTTSEGYRTALAAREAAEKSLLELGRQASGGKATGIELDLHNLIAALEPDDAAVAFRSYTRFDLEWPSVPNAEGLTIAKETSVESLCAFVVRPLNPASSTDEASALTLLDLGPLEPITTAVAAWHDALGAGVGRGVGEVARPSGAGPSEPGARIRRLVFDPLREAVAGAKRWVVVLDGPLQLVPLDALPAADEGVERLGDTLRIETRATLGELLDAPLPLEGENALVCLGGAEFDGVRADSSSESEGQPAAIPAIAAAEAPTSPSTPGILRGGAFEAGFDLLPGTLREIEGLEREFARSLGEESPSTLLRAQDATKDALLAAAPRARWLHIATHGWFAPASIRSWEDRDPTDSRSGHAARRSGEETVKGMSPMMLCGLALAGANLPEDALGRAPGLLTADELSTLDLSNCELAVLSACDTARGEMRRAGQGIASLQKALQIAGARSVVTSLWRVPDEATKELMLDFYRCVWVEKKPKWQALWEAKTRLRDAKDEQGRPKYTLRDWAAWVLTGEPE